MRAVGKEELVVVMIRGGKSLLGKGECGHFDLVRFRAHFIMRGEALLVA